VGIKWLKELLAGEKCDLELRVKKKLNCRMRESAKVNLIMCAYGWQGGDARIFLKFLIQKN
jgi:hypothetical protein